jgi:uncharacterized protein
VRDLMKRQELLKRTKEELLALAGKKGKRLSAKLRKADLVEQVLALFSPSRARSSARPANSGRTRVAKSKSGDTGVATRATALKSEPRPSPKRRTPRKTKQAPDQEFLRSVSAEISAQFALPFERTEIVLYEIDPFHAHAWWHVRLDQMEQARRSLGQDGEHAPLLLRFYDVTLLDFNGSNAHSSFDVPVHSLQSNFYIDFWESGRSYIVDIGLGLPDGRFHTLARSNHIELPPHAPSSNYDRSALVVDPKGNIVCEVSDVTLAETPGRDPPRAEPGDARRRQRCAGSHILP